jgi:hypothetical protein
VIGSQEGGDGMKATRCTATAKSTHTRCRRLALLGATVCTSHGVNGRTRRKAAERVALAELAELEPLAEQDRRHPWEVLADSLARLDEIMVRGQFTDASAYVEHVERVSRAAKAILDTRSYERWTAAQPAPAATREQLYELSTEAVRRVLDALCDELPAGRRERMYDWAAHAVLDYLTAVGEGREPAPPPPKPLPAAPFTPRGGRQAEPFTAADDADVVDAELVDEDPDVDGVDDAALDAELVELRALIHPARRTYGVGR